MKRNTMPMEIDIVSRCYNRCRKAVKEYSLGVGNHTSKEIRQYLEVIEKLEFMAECMDENQRLIIINEVFERKTNKWYSFRRYNRKRNSNECSPYV